MRNTNLYQVMDNKAANVMGPVMNTPADAVAIRHFTDALRDNKSMLGQHPEDFDLLCLGSQEETTGEITPYIGGPRVVLTGKAWAEVQRAESQS